MNREKFIKYLKILKKSFVFILNEIWLLLKFNYNYVIDKIDELKNKKYKD